MKACMIIARVNETDYLTKVEAESLAAAEHKILGLGICGRHSYGVQACMAFGPNEMQYDSFIYSAIAANPISFGALKQIIEKRNEEISEKDAAEERYIEIEKQMKALQEELEEVKATLEK